MTAQDPIRMLLIIALAVAARGEVIDRIAITAESSVITESELREAIRLTSFFNRTEPEYTPSKLREAGERLVDQLLLKQEQVSSRFPEATREDAVKLMETVIANYGSRAEFNTALAKYNLSEEQVLIALRRQLTTIRFINSRFGAGIRITQEEIRDYYRTEWRARMPASEQPPEEIPEEYRDVIESNLVQQRAMQQAENWLRETRSRMAIDFRPDVFLE